MVTLDQLFVRQNWQHNQSVKTTEEIDDPLAKIFTTQLQAVKCHVFLYAYDFFFFTFERTDLGNNHGKAPVLLLGG